MADAASRPPVPPGEGSRRGSRAGSAGSASVAADGDASRAGGGGAAAEPSPRAAPARRDSERSHRRLERTWSGTSGGSGASDGLSLPPGVRPPSASRVRQRQGIALRPSAAAAPVVIKAGTSKEDKAATRIASLYRGHSSRRAIQTQREEDSAVKVQAAFRGHTARAAVTRRRQEERAQALLAAKAAADKAAEDAARAAEAAEAEAAAEAAEAERLRQEALERERLEAEARAAAMRPSPTRPDPTVEKQLKDLRDEVEMQVDKVAALEGKLTAQTAMLKKRDAAIESLKARTTQQSEVLLKKDEQLTSLAAQISAMADVLHDRDKTKAALEKQVAELEATVAKLQPPEKVDVALDAKPIDDSRFLQERDRIIERQAEEVKLLQAEVAKLMGGIDQVEDQVDVMQTKVVSQDELYAMKKKEANELRDEVARLEQLLKEVNAREFAMDSATAQNEELLKVVQRVEEEQEKAFEARDEAQRLYAELEERHTLRIKEAAEASAKAAKFERDARLLRLELDELRSSVDSRVDEVTSKLDTTSKTAAVRLETMAEELRLRREKQYELLDKIRVLEEALQDATSRADEVQTQVPPLQQRNLDLEHQLVQAKQHREAAAVAAREAAEVSVKELEGVRTNLRGTQEELRVVKGQMTEMSSSVVRLAEKEQDMQQLLDKARETIRARDGELSVLKERVAQLVDEAMRANRDKAASDEKTRQAVESLQAVQEEHKTLVLRTRGMAAPSSGPAVGPQATARLVSTRWEGTGVLPPSAASDTAPSSSAPAAAAPASGAAAGGGAGGPLAATATSTAATPGGASAIQQARAAAARRSTMRRLLHMHCGTATAATAASPPSHLLAPAGQADASGDTAIPVASLLFGTDMFGNAATSTRVAAGSFSTASLASTLPSGLELPPADRGHDLESLRGVGLLDLSGLSLSDDDVAVLVHTLMSLPLGKAEPPTPSNVHVPGTINAPRPIRAIDLRGNNITDIGAVLLAGLLGGKTDATADVSMHVASTVALLDLRGNGLTAVGVRCLAEALRGNSALHVQHVFVGGEGFVRALGNKGPGGVGVTSGGGPVGIVAVYDLRGNKGDSVGDPHARATELLGGVAATAKAESAAGGGGHGLNAPSSLGSIPMSRFRPETVERAPPPAPPAFLAPPTAATAPGAGYLAAYPPHAWATGGSTASSDAVPLSAAAVASAAAAPTRQVQFTPAAVAGNQGQSPPQHGTMPPSLPPPHVSMGFAGTDVGPGPSFATAASSLSSDGPRWEHPPGSAAGAEAADHLLAMAAADEFLGGPVPAAGSSAARPRSRKGSGKGKAPKATKGGRRGSKAAGDKSKTKGKSKSSSSVRQRRVSASPYAPGGSSTSALPTIPGSR